MTNTAAPATTATDSEVTSALSPGEFVFDHRTAPTRDAWTVGKMRHVVKALDGALVALVIAKGPNTAHVGVRLIRTYQDGLSGPRVLVESSWRGEDGQPHSQQTAYSLWDVGTIIPLTRAQPGHDKWTATQSYMNEVSAAIETARKVHGEPAGRCYGVWSGECMAEGVAVRYQPLDKNPPADKPAGTRWIGQVYTDGRIKGY